MSGVRGRARQAGATYLLALLALTVLLALAVALTRIGVGERRMAVNAAARWQALSAAESGVAAAVTRLAEADLADGFELRFGEVAVGAGLRAANRTVVEDLTLLTAEPCHLCAVGQGRRFVSVHYAVAASGERWLWRASSEPRSGKARAARGVATTVSLAPWPAAAPARAALPEAAASPGERP